MSAPEAVTAASETTLIVTGWAGLTITQGTREETTWSELIAWLSTPGDENPPQHGWSAAAFKGDQRSKANVEQNFAVVLDVDSGAISLEQLRSALSGTEAFVHSTKSSTPTEPRWRIVVATSRPMNGTEHDATWTTIRDRLASVGVTVDEQTKDRGRFWYAPCRPRDGRFVFERFEGAPFVVVSAERRADATPSSTRRAGAPSVASWGNSSRYGLAALEREIRVLRSASAGERNGALNRSAFTLAQLVSGGELDEPLARAELSAAARAVGLHEGEATKTIASGFGSGLKHPRSRPERSSPLPTSPPTEHDHDDGDDEGDDDRRWNDADDDFDDVAAVDEGDPEFIKLGVDIHRVVDQCAAALPRCTDLFVRSNELVRVVRDGAPPPNVRRVAGAPTFRAVPPPTLLEELTRVQKFAKYDKRCESWVAAVPNASVLGALAARGAWDGMRPIVGLLEAPALRRDGTVIQAEGYDAESGYLLLPSTTFPPIADEPTHADALAARDELLDVVADFPFATDAHRSAWLAFALTLFARPAIDGCIPLVAVDSTAPGTGKGRLTDATAIIATGREATKTPLPQDDEEARKRITSLLLEGERLAVIDNVADAIALPSLDAVLTATVWRDRLLGKNASITVPNLTTWAVNGNNLTIGGDLARRTLHIRLESREENPENRADFKHHPLLPWVQTERPRLVRAALTILRAHVVAGRPACGVKAWGSFESWSSVVAAAVTWVDMVDPQATRAGLDTAADTVKLAMRALIDGWGRLTKDEPQGITVKRALEILYPPDRFFQGPPDGFDDTREAVEALVPGGMPGRAPSAAKLGARMRAFRRRVVGGRMLDGEPDRKGTTRWTVKGTVSAGHAGHAGHVPNPSRGNCQDKIQITGGNIACMSGMSGTFDDGEPYYEAVS